VVRKEGFLVAVFPEARLEPAALREALNVLLEFDDYFGLIFDSR
jgi:hypothetical protein